MQFSNDRQPAMARWPLKEPKGLRQPHKTYNPHPASESAFHFRSCAGFWTPAITKDPRAQLAGVQKAPRHEVAASWAPSKQRALSGFYAGAALDGKRDAIPFYRTAINNQSLSDRLTRFANSFKGH